MARHKDMTWSLPDNLVTGDQVAAAALVRVSAPADVVNDDAPLPVRLTAPVSCVNPPVTVVVAPE